MSGTYSPIRAKTHLQYARRLLDEAVMAERQGKASETAKKSLEAAEHAIKCVFNVTGVDLPKYKDMQDAISKGLREALDKEVHIKVQKDYADLKSLNTERLQSSDFVQKASYMLGVAIEITRGIWE